MFRFVRQLLSATALLLFLPAVGLGMPEPDTPAGAARRVVVLADPADAYHGLAAEIAAGEGVPVTHALSAALAADPAFLLWVAAPATLTEARLCHLGRLLAERHSLLSVGIISGTTEAEARGLWQRRAAVKGSAQFHVIAGDRIVDYSVQPPVSTPYGRDALRTVLGRADYLLYSGHGTARSWVGLRAKDVPALRPAVITTASCQTFQLWRPDSVALAFVARGAAAYAGFISSPTGDYLLGESDGVPLAHTWPDFPIGHAIQVQNRGTLRVFARFHQYFLLGDPRISLSGQAPYRVEQDSVTDGLRTLQLAGLPPGTVPIVIPDGAAYGDLEVVGIGRWMHGQLFFNSRMQAADHGDTKYLLVDQPGGEMELRLRTSASAAALAWRNLTDLADTRYIGNASELKLRAGAAICGLLWAGGLLWKQRTTPRAVVSAALLGVAVSTGLAILDTSHLGSVTVTAHPLAPNLVDSSWRALLIACAMLGFIASRGLAGRLLALLLVTFPAWLVPGILLPIAALLRLVVRTHEVAYDHWLMHCAAGVRVLAAAAFYAAVFSTMRHATKKRRRALGPGAAAGDTRPTIPSPP